MRRSRHQTMNARRSGVVLPFVLLSVAALLGVLAVVLDGGRTMEMRRRTQGLADATALAAADQLYRQYWVSAGHDPSGTARTAGLDLASTLQLPVDDVKISIPPRNGSFAGKWGYVQVEIAQPMPMSFGRALGSADPTISANAVAQGLPAKIGLIALRRYGPGTLTDLSPALTLLNGTIFVNSNDGGAFDLASPGVVAADRFMVVGGIVNRGLTITLGRTRTGVRPTADPLAFLPPPAVGTMPVRSNVPLVIDSVLPTILQPGVYRGGIAIRGVSVVVMTPGVYVMQGGGLRVSGAATVTGLETMIYNTSAPGWPAGDVSIAATGKLVLAAPLSGTYQGISLYQDRAQTTPIAVTGVGQTTVTGVIYAPKAAVALTGNAAVGLDVLGGALVADTIRVQGIGAINIDLKLNPPRIPDVRIVE